MNTTNPNTNNVLIYDLTWFTSVSLPSAIVVEWTQRRPRPPRPLYNIIKPSLLFIIVLFETPLVADITYCGLKWLSGKPSSSLPIQNVGGKGSLSQSLLLTLTLQLASQCESTLRDEVHNFFFFFAAQTHIPFFSCPTHTRARQWPNLLLGWSTVSVQSLKDEMTTAHTLTQLQSINIFGHVHTHTDSRQSEQRCSNQVETLTRFPSEGFHISAMCVCVCMCVSGGGGVGEKSPMAVKKRSLIVTGIGFTVGELWGKPVLPLALVFTP